MNNALRIRGSFSLLTAGLLTTASFNLTGQEARTVTFHNKSSSRLTNGVSGGLVVSTNDVKVALYWAPISSNQFTMVGPSVVVGVPQAGLFWGGTRTVMLEEGSVSAKFRVRAWSGSATNYEQALGMDGVLIGQSPVITNGLGYPGPAPPLPPVSIALNGLQGFTLTPNGPAYAWSVTCSADKVVSCSAPWDYDLPGASTTCPDTNITITPVQTTTNIQYCGTIITRQWTISDACGNTTNCYQTVTVTNDSVPAIVCAADKTVPGSSPWSFDAPGVTEYCQPGTAILAVVDTVTNLQGCTQIATRTWSVLNPCTGFSNVCSQTVTAVVTDCTAFSITKTCPIYPVPPGGLLSYTGAISNTTAYTISNVTVVCDHPLTGTLLFGPATLAPGATAGFANAYSVTACACGPHQDVLTVSGVGPFGIVFEGTNSTACAGTNHLTAGDINGDGIVDHVELSAVLANYWSNAPALYMTNPVSMPNGYFQFALTNVAGLGFTVLGSTNLADWTNLPSQAFPVYQFVDPEASNSGTRFYRLQYP